jgi:AsmA protein
MLPDPEALLRRSGAAAPLLDAIREQRARDRVRAAIERLTGAPRADANPPADQAAQPVSADKPQ